MPVRGARSLAVTGKTLWVGLSRLALLGRVDAEGASLVHVPGHSPDGYGPLLFGGRSVWVLAGRRLGELGASNRIRASGRIPAVASLGGFAVARDVWVAGRTAGTVLRLRLPRADEALAGVRPHASTHAQPNG